MGGKESTIKEYSQEGLKKFNSNFMYVKTEDDPRFGKVHLFKENTTSKFIALNEKVCQDLSQVDKLREKTLYHIALRHENLLKNIGYTRREEENMCSGKDIFTIFTEWYDHDLDKEIAERAAKKELFTEEELWYLARSVISPCAYLEKKNVYHGDIRPLNVLMNNEGKIYVGDHAFIHPLNDNWEKALNNHRDMFLSPQQMEELQKKAHQPRYDVFKADVFSLGMTLITAALLKSTLPAYDYSSFNVNRETVYLYLQNVGQNYSEDFTEFVASMVDFNEDSRPTFVKLETELKRLSSGNAQNTQNNRNQNSINQFPGNNSVANGNNPSFNPQTSNPLNSPFTNGSKYQNLSNSGTLPNQNGYLNNSPAANNQISQVNQSTPLGNVQNQWSPASNFGMKGVNMTGSRKRHQY